MCSKFIVPYMFILILMTLLTAFAYNSSICLSILHFPHQFVL